MGEISEVFSWGAFTFDGDGRKMMGSNHIPTKVRKSFDENFCCFNSEAYGVGCAAEKWNGIEREAFSVRRVCRQRVHCVKAENTFSFPCRATKARTSSDTETEELQFMSRKYEKYTISVSIAKEKRAKVRKKCQVSFVLNRKVIFLRFSIFSSFSRHRSFHTTETFFLSAT